MKKVLFLGLFILTTPQFTHGQHKLGVDSYGDSTWRAAEGGGSKVTQDKKTPLNKLIHRLEGNWELLETGKAYWIGYTDDMYSIAAYKEKAIQPLLDLFKETHSDQGRRGVIFTLHLIGIDSRIAGRFQEDFQNKKARNALLSLLPYTETQDLILSLLIRDPWPSDVPVIFSVLEKGTPNAWSFDKALQRYNLQNRPVHQELPKEYQEMPLNCHFHENEEFNIQLIKNILGAKKNKVVVEPELFLPKHWRGYGFQITGMSNSVVNGGFAFALETLTGCDYSSLGEQVDYYYENDIIHICGMKTPAQRWLAWYEADKSRAKGGMISRERAFFTAYDYANNSENSSFDERIEGRDWVVDITNKVGKSLRLIIDGYTGKIKKVLDI